MGITYIHILKNFWNINEPSIVLSNFYWKCWKMSSRYIVATGEWLSFLCRCFAVKLTFTSPTSLSRSSPSRTWEETTARSSLTASSRATDRSTPSARLSEARHHQPSDGKYAYNTFSVLTSTILTDELWMCFGVLQFIVQVLRSCETLKRIWDHISTIK